MDICFYIYICKSCPFSKRTVLCERNLQGNDITRGFASEGVMFMDEGFFGYT